MKKNQFVMAILFIFSILLAPVGRVMAAVCETAPGCEMASMEDSCCCPTNKDQTDCASHCFMELEKNAAVQGMVPSRLAFGYVEVVLLTKKNVQDFVVVRPFYRSNRWASPTLHAPPGELYLVHQSFLI